MVRHFTIQQAERLLEEIERELRQAQTLRRELAAVLSGLAGVARHVSESGGAFLNRDRLLGARDRRDQLAHRLKSHIESIQAHGCLIKDLEAGLVDFPTRFCGRRVYLCWKLGERDIRYWHEVEDGFRGRHPIDRHFLDHHSGDPLH